MATPHYIAKKVGDRYVLVRRDAFIASHKPELLLAAVALTTLGFVRKGPARTTFVGLGAACLTFALACGFIPCDGRSTRSKRISGIRRGPSFQNDNQASRAMQKPQDDIDEAVMESFPASDPPAGMSSGGNP